jgi:RHS repeat-associated protein
VVEDPVLLPAAHTTTTTFTYDLRGNRTREVTTTQTGAKTHTVSTTASMFDGMDQLVSTTGPEGAASWMRDGLGRALTITEDGTTRDRLFAGIQVVTDGETAITRSPDGSVLTETSTVTTGKGKNTTTTTSTVDVLTDLLGSPVATATGGVISADLALFGDFGDTWTTPKVDTVTGFTGHIETAGLVEFASRTYDPETRQWIQDDHYRGTVTRASSMNRYAYVEGAPESYVDIFGYFRARAAIEAQRLAAAEAAYTSAQAALLRATPRCTGYYGCYYEDLEEQARQAEQAATIAFNYNRARTLNSVYSATELRDQIFDSNGAKYAIGIQKKAVRDAVDANVAAYNKANDKGYIGGFIDTLCIAPGFLEARECPLPGGGEVLL